MYEKITILLRISDIDKYRQSIDSVMEQTYSNLDVWLFTDYFSTINEMKEKINISVYSYDEFEKYRIHKLPVDGYILLLQENEYFPNRDSLEKMYIQMKKEAADCSISSVMRCNNGNYYFRFTDGKIHHINYNNAYLYSRRYGDIHIEFRKCSGILFKAEYVNFEGKNEQNIVYNLLSNSPLTIFDTHNYLCFLEDDKYSFNDYPVEAITLPKYIDLIEKKNVREQISEIISIALCINSKYAKYIHPLIYSLDKHSNSPINLYLIYWELDSAMLEMIDKLSENLKNINIFCRKVSSYNFRLLSKIRREGSQLSIETYFRFLLPSMFPELERILYLDVDMLVVDDLSALWATPFDGNFIIASKDYPLVSDCHSYSYYLLGECWGNNYINAGMLLFNLSMFREYQIFDKLLQFVYDTSHLYFLDDQDAYNLFFNRCIRFVGVENNFVLPTIKQLALKEDQLRIIHYCGYSAPKPWTNNSYLKHNQYSLVAKYRSVKRQIDSLLYSNMKLAVIIDCKFGKENLENILEELAKQSFMFFDVYLINVSTDDIQLSRFNYITISVLQNSFEDLIKSFNKDCLYRYILTINNDVIIPDDDWLRQLVVRMYDNGWQMKIVETTKMPKFQEDIQVGIEDENIATIYSYVFLCNDVLKIGVETKRVEL